MNPVAAIARSGMNAAELSLRTAANNVANALTPGAQRQRVAAQEAAGGGVQAEVQPAPAESPRDARGAAQREVQAAERRAAEAAETRERPAAPQAEAETRDQGDRPEAAGVQPEDVVAQLQARNAFLANLQVFRRADEAQRRLLNDEA